MLSPAMRRCAPALLALIAILLAGFLSACGDDSSSSSESASGGSLVTEEAAEGEPLEINDLSYNVQITRFLNPDDTEDAEYLAGMPPPDPGTSYLGVFMVITNDTGDARPSATNYTVVDTLHQKFDFAESKSPYALDVGAEVPADGELPIPNTTAATGPNHGALLVFPVTDDVSDNRPLRLEIETFDGAGDVILDI